MLATEHPIVAVGLLSLLTHQVFRRYETFSIATHTSLICIPVCIGLQLCRATMPFLDAIYATVTVFLSGLLASVVIYRVSPFHPLAQYPGPYACRISKFWMAYIGYTGYQHLYIKRLHERYGDIVRIGPNELSVRDPSLLNDIFGTPGLPKGPLIIGRTLTATNPPLVGITDPVVHHERRKAWNRAFSATALKEYELLIANRATQLVNVLEAQTQTKGVNVDRFLNYFTYDFMCDMAFGGGSELLRDGDTNGIWSTIEGGWPTATFLSHVPWLAIYVSHIPVVSAPVAQLISHSQESVVRRVSRGAVRKDIFHYLSNEDQIDKDSPPVQQLIDDGILAIVAGADTTSSALTSLFFCVTTHPDAYKQLQAEVDQYYPAGEDPCDPKHHRDMHYLTAVINETLRLYPPLPSGGQRRVPHDSQGATLGPHFVPAGTSMFLHPYSLHRDPRNFSPDPERFWPARWLVAAGRAPAPADVPFTHNDTAFVPFSHGPANCVGRQLAMQEMRTVVCAVLQRLDVRVRAGWDARAYEAGFKDFFVTKRPTLPVTVHLRG